MSVALLAHQRPTWFSRLVVDERGRPYANLANAAAALENDPLLAGAFSRDLMSRVTMLMSSLPGGDLDDALPRPVRDSDIARVQRFLQEIGLPRIGREAIGDAIDLRAEDCPTHPLRAWLDALKWDQTKRVDRWLQIYLGAEPTPYSAAIGRMFLVAMAARIFEPGCKADYLLVLEGAQGVGKSSACRLLGGQWFSDALPDIRSGKDVSQHLRDKWLIEIAELSAISKADVEALKTFVSREAEVYRPSYGRREVHEKRQCLFIATTNQSAYLRDETGGRRFWPVTVGKIELDSLAADRPQLFAEAVAAYRAGARWWPDRQFEAEVIRAEQDARLEDDIWLEPIASWLSGRAQTALTEVAEQALNVPFVKLGTADSRRLTSIMKRLGWANRRTSSGRFWTRQGAP